MKAAIHADIKERDVAMQNPVNRALHTEPFSLDGKAGIAEKAQRDPEYGQIYAHFFDDPTACAAQLLRALQQDRDLFMQRMAELRPLLSNTASVERVVTAVMALEGPGAVLVKTAFAKELHTSLKKDAAFVAIGNVMPADDDNARVRVERLIPLLARVISQPDVATSLVYAEAGIGERRIEGMPSLRQLLELLLLKSYSEAVQVDVRIAISEGGANLLRGAADDQRTSGAQKEGAWAAGTLLGTAAAAQAKVGVEETLAAAFTSTLAVGGRFIPGEPGRVLGLIASVTGLVPPTAPTTSWTKPTVDNLLYLVYSAAHPPPSGLPGEPAVDDYARQYGEWHSGPAQAFSTAYNHERLTDLEMRK